ncbi:DEAD/DEAH box helicase [bacterium]|nr:DEAD/DEAH box helicase [bacterium]
MKPTLFSELDLSPELEKAIKKLGFEQASPIQAAAIPCLLNGKDVVGQSQTGSGKTAAFGIPAIERTEAKLKAVQVLVLCPTRELAVQVSEEMHKLAYYKRGIICLPIYGGQSYERQYAGLRQGAQIVIGTPGRVMDHMRRGSLKLDQLHTIILDEADVMLDMGFREDIEMVLSDLPPERQTVFFSATMPRPIRNLIDRFANEPESVQIEQEAMTVPTVEQSVFEVQRRFKVELLTRLIDIHDLKLGIIFCNTKAMVDDLVEHLVAQGYQADRLHGDMSQQQRDRVMNRFRKSGLEFLVATDVAARGIDVNNVEVVFNYDIPYDAEDYVHRIGRTGRAGKSGIAISFVSGREVFKIRNIERFTRTSIRRGRIPTLQDVDEARNSHVLNRVRETLQGNEFRTQDHLIERLLEEGFTSTDVAASLLYLLQPNESNVGNEHRCDELGERYTAREQDGRGRDRRGRSDREGSNDSRGRSRERFKNDRFENKEPRRRTGEARPFKQSRQSAPTPDRSTTQPEKNLKPQKDAKENVSSQEKPSRTISKPNPVAETSKVAAPETVNKVDTKEKKTPELKKHKKASKFSSPDENKSSDDSPDSRNQLRLNIGKDAGVTADQIREAILGETGVPESIIGKVELQAKHATIAIAAEKANAVMSKMKRANIAGKRVKAKLV